MRVRMVPDSRQRRNLECPHFLVKCFSGTTHARRAIPVTQIHPSLLGTVAVGPSSVSRLIENKYATTAQTRASSLSECPNGLLPFRSS
jgi:hypothetical protein